MSGRCLLVVSAMAIAASVQAQPATTRLEAVSGIPNVDRTTQTEDVRFKTDLNDRLTVPVRLSGTGPYRFLVDTGADRTAISRELAGKLKLVSGGDASVHSIAGVSTVSTALIPDLQLTRRALKIVDAPLLSTENIGADGILGVDSLRSQRVQFDFVTQTMTIVPSAAPDFHDEPGTIVVEASRRNGRLVVTDAIANGRPLTIVLDTGSQVTIGNEALRRQLVGRNLVDPSQKVELESVTGDKIEGDYMYVRELEIGGITLKDLVIVFADAHTFKQLRLDKKPALLLGMNAIRSFKKVSIDFANRKFRVVVPERSALDAQLASAGQP